MNYKILKFFMIGILSITPISSKTDQSEFLTHAVLKNDENLFNNIKIFYSNQEQGLSIAKALHSNYLLKQKLPVTTKNGLDEQTEEKWLEVLCKTWNEETFDHQELLKTLGASYIESQLFNSLKIIGKEFGDRFNKAVHRLCFLEEVIEQINSVNKDVNVKNKINTIKQNLQSLLIKEYTKCMDNNSSCHYIREAIHRFHQHKISRI